MTKLQTCSLRFGAALSGLKSHSLPAMVCIVFLFCTAAVVASPAQGTLFRSLANFNGTSGANPTYVSPVQGNDGNLYGTTHSGGGSQNCQGGCGTVFEITLAGALTTLYSFCSQPNCTDGYFPEAGLIRASDGDFYGTTLVGGENYGAGTVFKITESGTLTTLHTFHGGDGTNPVSALVQATDGNFYGTTPNGGVGGNCLLGCGTAFKMTPGGTLTTLHSFCSQTNCTDGANPSAGLVQATDGNFYGTTAYGGTSDHCSCGTVFKITPSGALTTLYSFCSQTNCTDGDVPEAGLIQATDGSFYGTTLGGGITSGDCNLYFTYGCGTVFKITESGTLTTLHGFNYSDGAAPVAGLVQATDGNFYGTTEAGGGDCLNSPGCGTVFKIGPAGTLTTLHSFDSTDGSGPEGGLVQAPNGVLYGTTSAGGTYNYGTVFRLITVGKCAICRP